MSTNGDRDWLDRYYTPDRTVRAILERVRFPFWFESRDPNVLVIEPHVGGGSFAKAARDRFRDRCTVVGIDVDPEASGFAACNRAVVSDWRETRRDQIFGPEWRETRCDQIIGTLPYDQVLIIGNPPYGVKRKGEWQEHVEHSFSVAPEANVVFVLKLSFLAGLGRHAFWEKHPPLKVEVLSRRPSFSGDGNTDRFTDYCVVTWAPYQMRPRETALGWILEDPAA